MPGADDTLNTGGPGPVEHDILDDLCTCGHRLGDHHTIDEACLQDGCACAAFQWTGGAFGHSEPTPEQIRARLDARDGGSMGTLDQPTRNNTREAADKTHADLAQEMDAEPMSPVESMSDEERIESDAVQAETLANLCTCGHPYGLHTVLDNHCGERDCVCLQFEPLLKPVDSAIDHEALERDRKLPYTPPLLRKRFVGEDELRQVLADVGRLDLLQQLPEVDRVTTNYGAEHWQEIERLARFPQGSSEATRPESERTITAIAIALLDLRQSLGATYDNGRMLDVIQKNTVAIQRTVEALDRIVDRVTGEDT